MFKLVKTVDLAKFGWDDCSLEFNSPTFAEMKKYDRVVGNSEATDAAIEIVEMVQSKFIKGTALNDKGEKVEVKKEDFANLPFDIVLHCITQISGGSQDPNL